MYLGRQVEAAMHCCIALATVPRNKYLSATELAELFRLHKPYLSKGLQSLSRARILEIAMGPTGGYRLARLPRDISMLQIVDAVEGDSPIYRDNGLWAFSPANICDDPRAAVCPVTQTMLAATRKWREHLAGVSIADLLGKAGVQMTQAALENSRA